MTDVAQAIRAAIDARPGTEEVCLALLEVLDAAERAATDPEALDAVIAASMALWDVPLTPDGARVLAAINHLAFGNESAAAAALAGEEAER